MMASKTSFSSRARIFVVRAGITLFILAACCVALEFVVARVYSEDQSSNWTAFHPIRGWALVPGEYWVKPLRDTHKVEIHVNELGFRSRDLDAGQRNAKRLVVLGDSFVFAKENNSEETFPQRLEKLLGKAIPGGVEVMNAGVPAYGTAQQLLLVRELYRETDIKPDTFLLMFFTNDTLDNLCLSYGDLTPQPVRPCFTLDEEGKPTLTSLPENQPEYEDDTIVAPKRRVNKGYQTISVARAWAEEWVQTKSSLVGLLNRMGVTPRVGRMPGLLNAWYRDEVVRNGVPLTAALIAQLQQEIREKGGRLVVSMVPSTFQVYPETYIPLLKKSFQGSPVVDRFASDVLRPQRLVEEMCRQAGVPFQDLLPIFLEHRDTALFIPRDGHLTRAGHKLASEALLPFVVDNMPRDRTVTDLSHATRLPSK